MARIENVCCEFEYRGQGLTTKLLEQVIQFSKEMGLKKLCLGTYDHLEKAIKFYENHGFVELKEKRDLKEHARYYELVLN